MAVAGERLRSGSSIPARAGGASSSLFTGSDEILTWLDVLLKGKPEDQARARTEIAMILEVRGFTEDAEEAYWTNVQARATDRRSYERLIAMYQLRRDRLSESLVRRQLDDVFSKPEPTRPITADRPASPARPASQPVSVARQLTGPERPAQTAPPVRRLRGARPVEEGPSPAMPDRRPAGPQAVQLTEVLSVPATPGRQGERRRAQLSPNPDPAYRRYRMTGGGLIALQPTTILAFVLASVGIAALIVFVMLSSDRSFSSRLALTGGNQLPARCTDATRRFPGVTDPRGTVVSAYRQQGVDVDAPRVGGARLSPDQAELVVGGWMAASLLLEHAGQPAPKLTAWLETESERPTLANAMLAGRHLDGVVTTDEWAEMQSWPASSCEGAFMHDPRNTSLVRLMERVVAR